VIQIIIEIQNKTGLKYSETTTIDTFVNFNVMRNS